MTSVRSQALFIFICGLVLFTIGLSSEEVIGFESRFYLFAQEMWRHGATWFPTTYQQPYPDYPGTATFIIYLCAKLCGGLSKFTAILPSAIAAAITLSVTYLIGSLHSRQWGIASVLFLLFTITFVAEARTISVDQYITAITTLCFYLVSSAQQFKKTQRIAWIFPLMVLGFAFRGPLGFVVPAGVVSIFYLIEKDFKHFFIFGLLSALLLGICCGGLLWLAHHVGGAGFMQSVLQTQFLGRMQSDVQTPPIYFYFIEPFGAYAAAYPIALLVLLGLLPNFRYSKTTKFLKKIVGWALIILIGLSIPGDKKMRYILPMAPALALICGYLFIVAKERKYFYFLKQLFVVFCFFFPLLCLIAVIHIHHHYPELLFSYHAVITVLVALMILTFLVQYRELFVFGAAVLAFMVMNVMVVEPINIGLNHTKDFVLQVEKLRQQNHAHLVFYHEDTDGLVIKYLINMPQEESLTFINTPAQLSKLKKPVLILVTEENYKLIPKKTAAKLHIVAHGYIGREPVVVISKNVSHLQGAS